MKPLDADVVVVGAGPAGSTTARCLALQGCDVLLVDRAHFPRPKPCGDGLTPRAVATLQRLGQLQPLLDAGYPRIGGARLIAPDGHDWQAAFGRYAHPLPEYGLMVPRSELDELLRQQAVEAGARFLGDFHAQGILRRNGRVTGIEGLLGGHDQTIRSRLSIVATGVPVTLPRALGVLDRLPPVVRAVRAYFDGVDGLDDHFEFHFRRELCPGYAWIFPMGEGRANVGLGLFPMGRWDRDGNPRRMLDVWLAQPDVAARFRHARQVGNIRSYPLRIDFPDSPVYGPGFLLVGEAAGLVNPITGEGIDLALESGEIAASVAGEALQEGDFSARVLRRYEREMRRQFANWFLGIRRIRPQVMRPRALNILIAKGRRWPGLGRTIVGIILGIASPHLAFSPLTWFYLTF